MSYRKPGSTTAWTVTTLLFTSLFMLSALAHAWKMEVGSTTTGQIRKTITFAQPGDYDVVPLVFILGSEENTPTAQRISEVTNTTFTVFSTEPQDSTGSETGVPDDTTIRYLVIEPGEHSLPDGTLISAAEVTLNASYQKGPTSDNDVGYYEHTFGQTFGQIPVVLAQLQGIEGEQNTPPTSGTAEPWVTVALDGATISSINVALEHSEVDQDWPTTNPDITVGILAVENATSGTFLDNDSATITWETISGDITTSTAPGRSCDSLAFSSVTFSTAPVVLASKMSRNTSDGGWVIVCDSGSGDGTNEINFAIEEDIFADAERSAATETVGMWAFSQAFDVDFEAGSYGANRLQFRHASHINPCTQVPITVSAVSQAGRVVDNYTGTIQVSTSDYQGQWVASNGSGTFSVSGNPAIAQYTFVEADNGSVEFIFVYDGSGATVSVTGADIARSEVNDNGLHPAMTVEAPGVFFSENPPSLGGSLAQISTQRAGDPFTIYLSQLGSSDGSCGLVLYEGPVEIELSVNYEDPVLRATDRPVTVSVDSVEYYFTTNGSSQHIPATFSNGQLQMEVQYDDVGLISLDAEVYFSPGSLDSYTLVGTSGPIVVQPYSMDVVRVVSAETGRRPQYWPSTSEYRDPTTWTIYPAFPLPTTRSQFFARAGEPLTVEIEVLNKQGESVRHFGMESTPQGIELEGVQVSPQLGPLPSDPLTVGTPFQRMVDGTRTYWVSDDVSYNEVGYFQIVPDAQGQNYMGGGRMTPKFSPLIGRIVPDHLSVTEHGNMGLTAACGLRSPSPFSYLGQPMQIAFSPTFEINAHTRNGDRLYGYRDDFGVDPDGNTVNEFFYRLPSQLGYRDSDPIAPVPRFRLFRGEGDAEVANITKVDIEVDPNLKISTPTFDASSGATTYSFEGTWVKLFSAIGEDVAPFDADLVMEFTVEDIDGIGTVPYRDRAALSDNTHSVGVLERDGGIDILGSNHIRHGRLFIRNTQGDPTSIIDIPLSVQYYDGREFVTNDRDACTAVTDIDTSSIYFVNERLNGISSTQLALAQLSFEHPTFPSGENTLHLDATALPSFTGTSNLVLPVATGSEHLLYDWPSDGSLSGGLDDPPWALITFGSYSPEDDLLFWREKY